MSFTSRTLGSRQLKTIVSGQALVCLLVVLTAPFGLYAGTTPPASAPVESPTNNGAVAREAKDPKKPEKYDIDHIGQRGIGRGFNLYSLKREHELGQSLAASFDRMTRVIHDPVVNDYINSLAQKIVRYSDADIPFTVKVIDSGDVPRAYGLPGGFLYVDSALILSADGEAELASVIAHEIAHVAARHATRALTRKHVCDVVGSIAMVAGPAGMGVADAGGLAGPLSVKKFSRDAEYEADLLGIEYAYAAGYDPQGLLDALEKLHVIELQRTEELSKIPGAHLASKIPFHTGIARGFSNYPLTEERIERLQAEIGTFLPERSDYVIDTNAFQEIKARLLASQALVLHHHAGRSDDDSKGPVLRRTPEVPEVEETPDTRTVPNFAFVK
jgi:Zn-dependent protease with chaperone function